MQVIIKFNVASVITGSMRILTMVAWSAGLNASSHLL